jgi:hypothetical protein
MNPRKLLLLCLLFFAVAPSVSSAATLPANTSNFSSVINGAAAGDTVELASGTYQFTSEHPAGQVTVHPASGASVNASVNLNSSAANLRLEKFDKFGGWHIGGASNITIADSTFTQPMEVVSASPGVVFDRDVFDGLGHGTWEGRLSFGQSASGVTVKNSHFGNGGCSDGIQVTGDSRDIQIIGNEFDNIKEGSCSEHADPIQFYGASNITLRDNYFHNNSTGIMDGDGNGSPMTLTNNVFVTDGEYPDQVVIGGGSGDVIDHNVFAGGARIRVGKVNVGFSTNETITNNVIEGGVWYSEGQSASGFTVSNNPTSQSYAGGSGRCAFAPAGSATAGLNDCGSVLPPPPPPAAQCADGIDNDGDSLVDYPADPGCINASDSDETNVAQPPVDPAPVKAPTFVTEMETSWASSVSAKATVWNSVKAGDVLVAYGMAENQPTTISIKGGGLTWTKLREVNTVGYGHAYAWTATAPADNSFNVTCTMGGTTGQYGCDVLVFRGSSGIGTTAQATGLGTPSLTMNTVSPNSAIVKVNDDWNARSGASRNSLTAGVGAFTEQSYQQVPDIYTIYGGFHANVGAAGAKTIGYNAPTGQKFSLIGVEVKGI